VPFLRSRPTRPLLLTTIAVAAVGVVLPFSPLASTLGFQFLPLRFLAMTVTYLGLVEAGKAVFYAHSRRRPWRVDSAADQGSLPQVASAIDRMRHLHTGHTIAAVTNRRRRAT
jgi:hypothetical protein